MGDKPTLWIKDYVNRLDDSAYSRLTMFQRGLLDELRRLRGRTGKNIRNDPKYIVRATQVPPKEAHCVPQAIRKLTSSGFLIPCNQELDFSEKKKNRERVEREETGLPPSSNQKSSKSPSPPGSGWAEEVEDAKGVIPAEAIRRAVLYYTQCPDPWYRDRGMTESLIRNNARRMVEGVPAGWEPKKPAPPKLPPDPNCPACFGSGYINKRIDGNFFQGACPCVKEARLAEAGAE